MYDSDGRKDQFSVDIWQWHIQPGMHGATKYRTSQAQVSKKWQN